MASTKEITMADLLAKYGSKTAGFSVGQKIKAKVIAKTPKGLILDIGGKSVSFPNCSKSQKW